MDEVDFYNQDMLIQWNVLAINVLFKDKPPVGSQYDVCLNSKNERLVIYSFFFGLPVNL